MSAADDDEVPTSQTQCSLDKGTLRRTFLRFYARGKKRCFAQFRARAATLAPVLQKHDVDRIVRLLHRCEAARLEDSLVVPVETFVHMLTFLPLHADRYHWLKQSQKRTTAIDRVMLSGTFAYFLVTENTHFKHPLTAPTSSVLSEKRQLEREPFLNRIRQNPKDGDACTALGNLMSHIDEAVILPTGEVLNQLELYLRAYQLNPNDLAAFYNHGLASAKYQANITLLDGRTLTKRDIYIEGISKGLRDAAAYVSLAGCIADDETCTFPDGTIYSKLDIYVKSLSISHGNTTAYTRLTELMTDANMQVKWFDGRMLNRLQVRVAFMEDNPNHVDAWVSLIRDMNNTDIVTLRDYRRGDKRSVAAWAVARCDKAPLYLEAGQTLSDDQVLEVGEGGRSLTKVQCFVEAIRRDPALGESYRQIGYCLKDNKETFRYVDGRRLNRSELYLEGMRHCPKSDWFPRALGRTLDEGAMVTLLDGRNVSEENLCHEAAIQCKDAATYVDLRESMRSGTTVLLHGKVMSGRMLLTEAWKMSPKAEFVVAAWVFELLANPLPVDAPDVDGVLKSMESAALADLKLKSTNWVTLYYLGRFLAKEGRSSTTTDDAGNVVTLSSQDCFIKALVEGGGECYPWLQLSKLAKRGPIDLPDGRSMTRSDLMAEALRLKACTVFHAHVDDHFYCTQVVLEFPDSGRENFTCDSATMTDAVLTWFSVPDGQTLTWHPEGNEQPIVLVRGVSFYECGLMMSGTYTLRGPVPDTCVQSSKNPPSDLSLVQKLDERDMGEVWTAFFQGQPVTALKTHRGSSLLSLAEWPRRLDAHANLQRIVGAALIFDAYDLRHRAWLLTEPFAGDLLIKQQAAQGTPWTTSVVAELGLQLCAAVGHIHNRRGLHLDVTPTNVSVSPRDEDHPLHAKLGPTILARCLLMWHFQYHRDSPVDVRYYSPEMCAAVTAPRGPHSDVYSVAATMWFAATGWHHPWGGSASTEEIVRSMADGTMCASPLSAHPECGCSVSLDALIKECMALPYEDRPSLAQVEARLRNIQLGE